jgi:hypothetical protein
VEFPALPAPVLARARAICTSLPEVVEVQTDPGREFKIRRRTFASVFAIEDPAGAVFAMLACRSDPDERAALLELGHPYFAPRSGFDRIGVVLDDDTDWDEIAELVVESYRLLAPQKLVELVERPPS